MNQKEQALWGPFGDDYVEEYVLRRFELLEKIGHSADSVVWRARRKDSRKLVALKKLYGILPGEENEEVVIDRLRRACREIEVLQNLGSHDSLVGLQNVIEYRKDVFLVFEFWQTDLHLVIRSKVLQHVHVRWITCQLALALAFLHQNNIVHFDVKPSNVLINENCQVKLADFGHSKPSKSAGVVQVSHYVGSRWYRPPELLLGAMLVVPEQIDIWGLGCILGEMIASKPLFPGKSAPHQLQLVLSFTGIPRKDHLAAIPGAFEQIEDLPSIEPISSREIFQEISAEALDFLRQCLQFKPEERHDALRGLRHPFVLEFSSGIQHVGEIASNNGEWTNFENAKLQTCLKFIQRFKKDESLEKMKTKSKFSFIQS